MKLSWELLYKSIECISVSKIDYVRVTQTGLRRANLTADSYTASDNTGFHLCAPPVCELVHTVSSDCTFDPKCLRSPSNSGAKQTGAAALCPSYK